MTSIKIRDSKNTQLTSDLHLTEVKNAQIKTCTPPCLYGTKSLLSFHLSVP